MLDGSAPSPFRGWLARRAAEADFIFGDTLGRWYYEWLPPTLSTADSLMGVAVVLAFLAIIAALSGLLTDPLQAHLGIHERRLRRMVRHLGKDLQEAGNASYHPRDPYLARVVDAVDAIRGPLGWVRMGAVKDGLTPMATWENKKSWLEEWSPKMALLNTPAVSVTAALSAEEGRNGDRG